MKNPGEQFLHQKDSKLHQSKPVEHEKARKKRKGEEISQKPSEKITDFLKVLEKTHGHHDDPRVLERIKKYYYKKHVIKPKDVPESYFENQRRLTREQGHGDVEITDEMRTQLIEVIIADQNSTLNNWVDYLSSPDAIYPTWAKYWAFNGMLKLSTFDKEKHAFAKRRKDTVAPFADLNREALAYVVDAIVKKVTGENIPVDADNPGFQKLLQGANFGKLYTWAIEKVTPAEEHELLNIDGEWIKYDKGSDHMPLVESLQGHGTGWCTAGEETAKTQLKTGDLYIYYSHDEQNNPTVPRLAMRMQDDSVAEVRGIAHEQNIDPHIADTDILNKKLKKFGKEGEQYKKKSADMKRLTEIDKKNDKKENLSKQDLKFLYEIDGKIQGFGYQKDPRINEILEGRNIKKDISFVTGFSEDQISTTKEEASSGGIMYHYGNIELRNITSAKGLKLPYSVSGDLNLHNLTSAKGLKLPDSIGGDLRLWNLISAKGLNFPSSIGGDLELNNLTSTKGLKLPDSVSGDLNLNNLISAKGLKLPDSIGGDLGLWNLISAKGLKLPYSVSGDLHLHNLTSAEGLKLPDSIGGDLNLHSLTSAKDLKFPNSVNGNLDLHSLTSAKGVKLPDWIGEWLNLQNLTSAEGLKLPDWIGGNLIFFSLTSTKGMKLPDWIGGSLILPNITSAEGLKFPNSIGNDLILGSLTSANNTKCPNLIGGCLDLHSLTSAKGLKLPESIGDDLNLESLISAEGLKFPDSIGGWLNLCSLTSDEGLKPPDSIGGSLWLSNFTSAKKNELRKIYPRLEIR